MKLTIETLFNPGDTVWRKNLVTNEAKQVKITHVDVYVFLEEGKQSYLEMYHDGEAGPMCNIPGKVSPNNAFATREEADACPCYILENDKD